MIVGCLLLLCRPVAEGRSLWIGRCGSIFGLFVAVEVTGLCRFLRQFVTLCRALWIGCYRLVACGFAALGVLVGCCGFVALI